MKIYLISATLKSLTRDTFISSSQKYEYDFAKSLSAFTKVEILSAKLDSNVCEESENLSLVGIKSNTNSWKKNAEKILLNDQEDKVVLFWGYDLIKVLSILTIKNKLKIKCVPFIFDYHFEAISNFGLVKRILADVYFKIGKFFIRFFDAVLLFQEKAAKELHIKNKPFFVTKPGYNESYLDIEHNTNIKDFNVVYCGTLSRLNGIDILLDAFKQIDNSSIKLQIFGYGPLDQNVIDASNNNPHISFGGKIEDKEFMTQLSRANLLINLRTMDIKSMNYAFPSKVFEYVAGGVPLLSTRVIDNEEFLSCINVIEHLEAKNVADSILDIYHNYDEAMLKAQKAREYIKNNFNYYKLAKDVYEFLTEI